MPNAVARSKYQKLVADISGLYEDLRKAVVGSYWRTGQHIVEVEQDGEIRARYGSELIPHLSKDLTRLHGLGFSVTSLKRMRQFFLLYPKGAPVSQLSWSHHVQLLPVEDAKKRKVFEKLALSEGLKKDDLGKLVREEMAQESPVEEPPAPKLPPLKPPVGLKLATYRKIDAKTAANFTVDDGEVLMDCGFFFYLVVPKEEAVGVTVTDKPSYAYAAKVERVVDGDTLWVVVDLGFKAAVREKLRLRGINTPELGTPLPRRQAGEGEKANASGRRPGGPNGGVKS